MRAAVVVASEDTSSPVRRSLSFSGWILPLRYQNRVGPGVVWLGHETFVLGVCEAVSSFVATLAGGEDSC